MNLTSSEAVAYLDVLRPLVADILDRELFVLPAFPVLWVARDRLSGSRIAWGAQDVHAADGGAHTGDVAAPMLLDLGCRYVAVGHAERRRDHGESAEGIAAKVAAILRWGMSPIVCVGDSRPQAPSDALEEILPDLERCLAGVAAPLLARVVVAYEPTWAIGAGATAAPAAAVGAVHDGIRSFLEARGPGGGGRPGDLRRKRG